MSLLALALTEVQTSAEALIPEAVTLAGWNSALSAFNELRLVNLRRCLRSNASFDSTGDKSGLKM